MRARVLPLLLLLLLLAGEGARAQEVREREVPLRAFASEAQAHAYLMQQAEHGVLAIARAARALGCNSEGDIRFGRGACMGERGVALLDDSGLLVHPSRRPLMWVDSTMEAMRTGSGAQWARDALLVMRDGELVRVDVSGERARVTDVLPTRLTPLEWSDDSSEEVLTRGDLVITFDHNRQSHAVLRTYTVNAQGRLSPRDTVFVTGEPPRRLEHLATRVRGRQLLLYTSWPVRSDFDESSALVAFAAALPDGQPVVAPAPDWFRRVYRPVSGVEAGEALNHVHALLRCDLGAAAMACTSTLVMGATTRRYTFTDRALEIETALEQGVLHLVLPYDSSLPRALRGERDTAERITRVAGQYRLTTTRSPASQRGDASGVIADTVTVTHAGLPRSWRTVVPHQVERALAVGSRLLLVGPANGAQRATLLRLADSAVVVHELLLPDAGDDFGGAVLTAQRLGSADAERVRVGYTVVDFTADSAANPYDAHNGAWFFEVRGDSLVNLGLLRASAETFSEAADVFPARMRLGVSQAMLLGERVFVLFHRELVEGRVVNGGVEEVGRRRLVPE